MYEKRDTRFVNGVLWGTIIANGMHMIVRAMSSDVDTDALQRYNQQITSEVAAEMGETPADLIVEEDDTFTFTMSDGSDRQECEGTYTVNEDVAAIAGEITCSSTITVKTGEN